jgi:hypothetical protein
MYLEIAAFQYVAVLRTLVCSASGQWLRSEGASNFSITASGIFYVNTDLYSKSTNTVPVTIRLTIRDNHIDLKYE